MAIQFPLITGDSAGYATIEALDGVTSNITEIVSAVTAISDSLGTAESEISALDFTLNSEHIPTDISRWQNFYNDELIIHQQLATSQGLKPDTNNITNVPQDVLYTVASPAGGLLTVVAKNENGFYTTIQISGINESWDSSGLLENVQITKYFRVLEGNQIIVSNAVSVTITPAIEDPDNPIRISMQKMQVSIAENKNNILNIQAGITNKKLSGTKIDIESATQGSGYTVNNTLGGRITGQGVNAILGSTGIVDVTSNSGTTRVYDNLGLLSLLDPVPQLVIDVADGDTITSSGMSEIFFETYVQG